MQSSDRELLKRIEKKLQSKHVQGDVKIRDIMAINPDGEFLNSKNKNETEENLIHRMNQHIEETAHFANAIHIRENFEGFAYVIKSDREPNIEDIPTNTLVALHEDNQLTIYWIEDGKLTQRSFSENSVSSIIDRLPETNNASKDSKLVQDIVSQYGCIKKDKNSNITPQDILKMKANCEDNITRLSFNEFSFYPHETHGPLTTDGFNKFTKQLEKTASKLPENLHLLVASVPVVDTNNDVHNMICYVQCGNSPKINTFAKAVPSNIDFIYPGTANAFHTTGSNGEKIYREVVALTSRGDNPETNIDDIKKFMKRAFNNPNFKPSDKLINMLNAYVNVLESMGDIKDLSDTQIDILTENWNKILKELHIFRDATSKKNIEYNNLANDSLGSLPNMTLTNTSSPGNQYGGQLTAKTFGATPFIVSIDLCLDHLYGVAKNSFHKNLQLSRESIQPGTIPLQVSSMVTSASVPIIAENIISQKVVHTDTLTERVGVKSKEKSSNEFKEYQYQLTKSSFGKPPNLIIHAPVSLGILSGEVAGLIAQHNRFSIKVQALKQLAMQQPRLREEAQTELAQLLAEEATLRSKLWTEANPNEKSYILRNIHSEFTNIKDELLDHVSLGSLVERKSNKIDEYLKKKYSLIKDLKNFIDLYEKKSSVESFFHTIMDPGLEMRVSTSKILLHSLMFNKRLSLTKPQLSNLLEENSATKNILNQYYNYNIDNLLPKTITDEFNVKNKPLNNRPRL